MLVQQGCRLQSLLSERHFASCATLSGDPISATPGTPSGGWLSAISGKATTLLKSRHRF